MGNDKKYNELLVEMRELQAQLQEATETLNAIKSGEVDALILSGPNGEQVFTLKGVDYTYRLLIEQMNEGAVTVNAEGIILYGNRCLERMLKMPLAQVIGSSIHRFLSRLDSQFFDSLVRRSFSNSARGELSLIAGDGTPIPVQVSISYLSMEEENCNLVVVSDLTEHKMTEEIINEERLSRSILEQIAEAVVVCNRDLSIIRASHAAAQLCSGNPLLQRFEIIYPLEVPGGYLTAGLEAVIGGESLKNVPARYRRADGREFHLVVTANPLRNRENVISGCVITLTDITEQKRSEERINASLKEKEILLKEIHHRVKNNMQVISSMLNLQTRSIRDKNDLAIFNACKNRIYSMATIHELLYRSSDLSRISLAEYIRNLLDQLFDSFMIDRRRVSTVVNIRDVYLDINKAMPCAMIINELVSNSLKYAFPAGESGTIAIDYAEDEHGGVLVIADNGIGLPPDYDPAGGGSMGLLIVTSMVKKLRGSITYEPGPGTRIVITLPPVDEQTDRKDLAETVRYYKR